MCFYIKLCASAFHVDVDDYSFMFKVDLLISLKQNIYITHKILSNFSQQWQHNTLVRMPQLLQRANAAASATLGKNIFRK